MTKIEQRKRQKFIAVMSEMGRAIEQYAKMNAARWPLGVSFYVSSRLHADRAQRIASTPADHFRPDEPRMDMRRVRRDQRKHGGKMIRLYPDGGRREVHV